MGFETIYNSKRTKRVTLQYDDGDNSQVLLAIDCTVAEEITLEAQATTHAVEDGSDISDHVLKKGRGYQIQGIVSDTPINLTQAAIGNAAGIAGSVVGGQAGKLISAATVVMTNLAMTGESKPSKAALDIFEQIYDNSIPVTIVGGLTAYANMIMEKYTAKRTAGNGGALNFSGVFRQIRIVSGQSVTVPASARAEDVADLAAEEQQQGRKQGTELTGTKKEKAASWLSQITGIGG